MEDPWYDATTPADADMYVLSVSPEDAPDKAEYVEILFEKGNAIGLRHEALCEILGELGDVRSTGERDGYSLFTPYGVMRALNLLGGRNGIGRIDIVENRFVGMKSRGVYETPGGTILLAAHRDLETLVVDREAMHIRDSLIPTYAQLVYNGFWFAPEREAIQASARHRDPENRFRRGPPQVIQRQRHASRLPLAAQHVFRSRRHHGRRPGTSLQPGRRHRLHRPQRPAPQGQRHAGQVNWSAEFIPRESKAVSPILQVI